MKYDFIDIGSSNKGGSIRFAQSRFGNNGYGIDIDERKVNEAVTKGYDVRLKDIFEIDDRATWVTMIHVLEHLPSKDYCFRLLKKACEIGDNLYIAYPYFDADGYLYERGLRCFWSNWTGHTLHLSKLELHNMLTDLGVEFEIESWFNIPFSSDKNIVPLNAPKDGFEFSLEMGEKKIIPLTNVFKEVRCIAHIR